MDNYIQSLNWRYATKKYNADKRVSDKDLKTLKEAVRLSASSYGLRPYRVIVVESAEVKKQLSEAAMGMNKNTFTDASELFIFAIEKNVNSEHVESYMNNISETRNMPKENLQQFADMINGSMQNLSSEQKDIWAAKQAYIALGNLLSAAALLNIDSTPMEGLDNAKVDEILGLDKLGLSTVVVGSVGYRHEEDPYQHMEKVRKSEDELFITL